MATPIRELGLTITETPLNELITEFRQELEQIGIRRLKPDFYLSTEWGVPFESISIGIPFYLAQPTLGDFHTRHVGHLEGVGRAELLRYLRHEMGHVVNSWPEALAKLEYCDRTMSSINERDPLVTATDHDEDVSSLTATLQDFYRVHFAAEDKLLPPGLDGPLLVIFEDYGSPENHTTDAPRSSAGELILKLERDLVANVYRWTGHFPEATRRLLHQLAARAEAMHQVYPADHESSVTVAVTVLVTSLAMNHVLRGNYTSRGQE